MVSLSFSIIRAASKWDRSRSIRNRGAFELAEVIPGQAGRDVVQLKLAIRFRPINRT
jgi:hypothetical protein